MRIVFESPMAVPFFVCNLVGRLGAKTIVWPFGDVGVFSNLRLFMLLLLLLLLLTTSIGGRTRFNSLNGGGGGDI